MRGVQAFEAYGRGAALQITSRHSGGAEYGNAFDTFG
jgi:hypothetical protein